MTTPLLTTKPYIPPLRSELVSRPGLIERLNEDLRLGRKLTLISAPAGFGKTTLVSHWVAGCERPVAWLSLDEGDNDPTRFPSTSSPQQILEAAFEVFSQKGFSAATVSDVAARAGVKQGTVSWYFDSKKELLSQVLLSFFDDLGHGAMRTLEQCATVSAKLRTLGEALVGFAASARGLLNLFLELWASSAVCQEVGPIWIDLPVEYKESIVRRHDHDDRSSASIAKRDQNVSDG